MWPCTKIKVKQLSKLEMAAPKDHSCQVGLHLVKRLQRWCHLKVLPYIITVTLKESQGQPFFVNLEELHPKIILGELWLNLVKQF